MDLDPPRTEAPGLAGAVEHVGTGQSAVDLLVKDLLKLERRRRASELQHLDQVNDLIGGRRVAGLELLEQARHDGLVAGEVGDVTFVVALLDHQFCKIVGQAVVDPLVDLGCKARSGDGAAGDLLHLLDNMLGLFDVIGRRAAADIEVGQHSAVIDPLADPVLLPLLRVQRTGAFPHVAHQFRVLHGVVEVERPGVDRRLDGALARQALGHQCGDIGGRAGQRLGGVGEALHDRLAADRLGAKAQRATGEVERAGEI